MQGAPFYDAGTSQEVKGIRKAVLLARRLVRRLLRPMLLQLDEELKAMADRQDQLDQRLKSVLAMGWDHAAMARRLAVIEDHLDDLLSREASNPADGEIRRSIRYPGREGERAETPNHLAAPKSLVS